MVPIFVLLITICRARIWVSEASIVAGRFPGSPNQGSPSAKPNPARYGRDARLSRQASTLQAAATFLGAKPLIGTYYWCKPAQWYRRRLWWALTHLTVQPGLSHVNRAPAAAGWQNEAASRRITAVYMREQTQDCQPPLSKYKGLAFALSINDGAADDQSSWSSWESRWLLPEVIVLHKESASSPLCQSWK